jgi:hypothetical protein
MSDLLNKAIELKQQYEKQWLSIDGVVGVGVGMEKERPAIIISTVRKPETLSDKLPGSIEGIEVILRQTGAIRAQ